jgi:hypothetical protein
MVMDLEATVRRQREVIQTLSKLIAELMIHVNADDFDGDILIESYIIKTELNEQERIELRDRVEATMNRFIEEGLIDLNS